MSSASFTTSVNALQTRGLLTEAHATDLLQQAQAIEDAIGCSSSISSAQEAEAAAAVLDMTGSPLPFS